MTSLKSCQQLLLEQQQQVLHITLNRPASRNAMSLAMLDELLGVLRDAGQDRALRAIVLRGAEGHFCAGGDVRDMANARSQGTEAYRQLNRRFGQLLEEAAHQPQVVLAVLEGAVLGGGLGLACIADISLCRADTQFGMPETSLGIIPAQIAPFVVQRIGLTQSRRLALTAARFDGNEALRLGLVHSCAADAQELEQQLADYLVQISRCAPQANAGTKALLLASAAAIDSALLDQAADWFAAAVSSDEGAEGTLAFVQKRPPVWARSAQDE